MSAMHSVTMIVTGLANTKTSHTITLAHVGEVLQRIRAVVARADESPSAKVGDVVVVVPVLDETTLRAALAMGVTDVKIDEAGMLAVDDVVVLVGPVPMAFAVWSAATAMHVKPSAG